MSGRYARCGHDRARAGFAVAVVSRRPDQGDYVSVGRYLFALRPGMPGDLDTVSGLVREAAGWLRTSKNTDQWAEPWPDRIRQRERILNDLLKGKTWLVWDGEIAAATITVDTDEPLDLNEQPVWPEHERHRPALYVRRIVVARSYAGHGPGRRALGLGGRRGEKRLRGRTDPY